MKFLLIFLITISSMSSAWSARAESSGRMVPPVPRIKKSHHFVIALKPQLVLPWKRIKTIEGKAVNVQEKTTGFEILCFSLQRKTEVKLK